MRLKSYLESLDDERFLSVARLLLAKVTMPFSRQSLQEKMLTAFASESSKQARLESVDETDSKIISLVYFIPGLSLDQIGTFIGLDGITSRILLSSLERRLLLLSKQGLYYPNDLVDLKSVISSEVFEEKPQMHNIRVRELIYAFASFANAHELVDNVSKAAKQIDIAAYPLMSEEELRSIFSRFIKWASFYGYLLKDGSCHRFDNEKFSRISHLSTEKICLMISGFEPSEDILRLQRMMMLCQDEEKIKAVFPFFTTRKEFDLILPYPDPTEKGKVILTEDFNLIAPTFADTEVYRFAECTKLDVIVTYTITRNSIHGAFDSGLTADGIIAKLEEITEVPESIRMRLRSWQAEYDRICFTQCIFFECDEMIGRIISKNPKAMECVIKQISDRAFLVYNGSEEKLRSILKQSGVDLLPKTRREDFSPYFPKENRYERDDEDGKLPPFFEPPSSYEAPQRRMANLLKLDVNDRIKKPEEKDGYISMIEKGYITDSSQIVPGRVFAKERSASGFNFQQKLILISQAKEENALVEITTESGKELCYIRSLENAQEKSTVTIESSHELKTLSVASIFLIKIIEL